jgi:hypothetical protein
VSLFAKLAVFSPCLRENLPTRIVGEQTYSHSQAPGVGDGTVTPDDRIGTVLALDFVIFKSIPYQDAR